MLPTYLFPSCSIEGEKINSLSRHGLVTDPQGLLTVIVRTEGKLRDAIGEQEPGKVCTVEREMERERQGGKKGKERLRNEKTSESQQRKLAVGLTKTGGLLSWVSAVASLGDDRRGEAIDQSETISLWTSCI